MGKFEKREWDENTWFPEVAGVDFTDRLQRFMGEVAMDGTELYTAWLVTDEVEIQVTPESSRVYLSLLDDDSDTIQVLDPSDGLWFNFMRFNHQEVFDDVRKLITPWTTSITALTPSEDIYERFLKSVAKDTAVDNLFIPDDWN